MGENGRMLENRKRSIRWHRATQKTEREEERNAKIHEFKNPARKKKDLQQEISSVELNLEAVL